VHVFGAAVAAREQRSHCLASGTLAFAGPIPYGCPRYNSFIVVVSLLPRPVPAPGSPTSFDPQAAEFDRRVGWPEEDCRAIAAAVLDIAAAGAGGLAVEIGAGTGMIGRWFFAHPVRYAGLDVSRGMLEVFQRRLTAGPSGPGRGGLAQADAAVSWPVPDGAARVVFSSRAIHLLPAAHVVAEVFRVGARDGSALVLGWVERPAESVKARLSREMQRRLRERGFPARSAGSRRLLEAFRERGARVMEKTTVARRTVRYSPRRSLDDWRGKQGLGGLVLPPGVQEEVLDELEAWAAAELGDLEAEREMEEAYVLEGARLPSGADRPVSEEAERTG
jgi:ubiquinone/menaquinone biosynthesis C-methylase UbiE